MDKYTKDYIKSIKKCTDDKQISIIINTIYTDGFSDGINEERITKEE